MLLTNQTIMDMDISSGGGRALPVKPYFLSFHRQHCLKIPLLMKQLSTFESTLTFSTNLTFP